MSKFAWPVFLRAGLSQLRLKPDEFWALTPAELMVMLGVGPSTAPMGRRRLDDLVAAFPDQVDAVCEDPAKSAPEARKNPAAPNAFVIDPAPGTEKDTS